MALAVLLFPTTSARADGARWWVSLPRAESAQFESPDLPWPPVPGDRALARRAARGRPDQVEVLSHGPSVASIARVLATGARIYRISRWNSSVSVEVKPESLAALRREFGRAAVTPVRVSRGRAHLPTEPVLPAVRRAWALPWGQAFRQLQISQTDSLQALGYDGQGLRVLVLDTGFFRDLPVFQRLRVISEWDFVHNDGNTANDGQDPAFQHDHGTLVLSTLAGWEPGTMIGAAPGAEFLLAKTEWVATETRVEEDNYVAALEWGEALGADLMSASLSYFSFPDEPDSFTYTVEQLDGDTAVTTRAVDDLAALGVVCLVAAGNSGPGITTIGTPADADSALAIAAVDSFEVLASFSSRGPTADGRTKPDVATMGHRVFVALKDSTYARVSGTSVAAPLATGAAALVMCAHPEWDAGMVRDTLRATATQSGAPDNDLGWGILQVVDAVFAGGDPVYPVPFGLIAPADSAVTAGPVEFRWRRAKDFQTPASLDYRIQFSTSAAFLDTLATYQAFSDSQRTLEFLPSGDLHWRVVARDPDGNRRASVSRQITIGTTTAAPGFQSVPPLRIAAVQPNPSRGRVRVFLELGSAGEINVEVFDLRGRRVRNLAPLRASAGGERIIAWDGTDLNGARVASGTYMLRAAMRLPDGHVTRSTGRITVVR